MHTADPGPASRGQRPAGVETAATAARPGGRAVRAILDVSFGYMVWAVHFLGIYCVNALACARGAHAAGPSVVLALKAVYLALTLAALALVGWHAWRRRAGSGADEFLSRLTVASDALAIAGIALQVLPIVMLGLCR